MTLNGWLQIVFYSALLLGLTRPLGVYMYRVFEGERQPLPRLLGPVERALYRLSGVDPQRGQTWQQYTLALLAFSLVGLLVTYAIQRLQHLLPLNPQAMGPVEASSAFNTAASFTSNTNWQGYAGETTMSYFSQMVGLAWHNFVSAAAGIAVAIALARGIVHRGDSGATPTLGNFWVDLLRGTLYLLLPLSFVIALFLISQGAIQNFSPYVEAHTLEGAKQTIAMGPLASQEAIKMLGTNGGGFFNANSAHPFENPNPLTNFVELFIILWISAALTYTYGRMVKDQRQGWALWAAMFFFFAVGVVACYAAESAANPALRSLPVAQTAGNLEGKEVRFGVADSALWAVATTDASNGSVNAMHDSFTPLGGLIPLFDIQLGEVVFGGVGSGLYGMLVFALLAVFIAGLMVGRTPEYLGKKIEAYEVKLAAIFILIMPFLILGGTAWAAVAPYGVSSLANAGPHGLSELLYAFSSGAGNNGSAFAGLNANTPFWNTALGITMIFGRFAMIVPVMAIAGSLAKKKIVPPSAGTFPTNGALFVGLLIGVVLVVGALTFFPALSLGPVVEHFVARTGRLY